jgi:hypothetical protein
LIKQGSALNSNTGEELLGCILSKFGKGNLRARCDWISVGQSSNRKTCQRVYSKCGEFMYKERGNYDDECWGLLQFSPQSVHTQCSSSYSHVPFVPFCHACLLMPRSAMPHTPATPCVSCQILVLYHRVSRNHIRRCISLAIFVDAGPKEQYNTDSKTRRCETMVRLTLSNFADFAFV